jgi:hypothetical protein
MSHNTIRYLSVLTALCLSTLAACGGDEGGSFTAADIVNQNPQGSMEGSAWSMASALVRVDSFDAEELSVSLHSTAPTEACPFIGPEGPVVLFRLPRMQGEYPLSFDFSSDSRTITFSPSAGQNIIASDGVIVVEALSDTEVTIGLVAEAGASSINGKFTTMICP